MKRSEKYKRLWQLALERAKDNCKAIKYDVNLSREYLEKKKQAREALYKAERLHSKYTTQWLKENKGKVK